MTVITKSAIRDGNDLYLIEPSRHCGATELHRVLNKVLNIKSDREIMF